MIAAQATPTGGVCIARAPAYVKLAYALRGYLQAIADSKANFLLVDFNSKNQANKVFSFLKNQNIYVRKVTDYGLSKSLRITVGTNDECKLVKKNVQKFLELDNGL